MTKPQITKQKQIHRKHIPPPSAAGFTHSGDEDQLVTEKNHLGKTKTEYVEELRPRRLVRVCLLVYLLVYWVVYYIVHLVREHRCK
jgi:hypothetical protein